jgi:hypothetical protein
MRIVALVSREGFTKNLYEQLMQNMKLEDNPPRGMVTHIATFDSKGIRVTDVWESESDFRSFHENRLMPGLQKIGFKELPKVEIYPLHTLVEAQQLNKHAAMH